MATTQPGEPSGPGSSDPKHPRAREPSATPDAPPEGDAAPSSLPILALGALGVVFGDIGTSPIYALRECFAPDHGLAIDAFNVLGVLSLIVWSLILVVSIQYAGLVLRADNHGEGGILALLALVQRTRARRGARGKVLLVIGLFGAALLYGDGAITPAISVLSAVEGLETVSPALEHFVVPVTVAILVVLFAVQRGGTARVGAVFGPVMILWFSALAVMGIAEIVHHPGVLRALDPRHGVAFLVAHGRVGLLVLASVFLVITGAEAVYADMGHFGRVPIRLAWWCLVLPALLLVYFGQGALILRDPAAASGPFFALAPQAVRVPLVVLATLATVIASQAVISGAFSLTRQAVQLGYLPRMAIEHTSASAIGQIYVPWVNRALFAVAVALVVGMGSSSRLAGAYGLAVTATMVITTILLFEFAVEGWRWSRWIAAAVVVPFLGVHLTFLGANSTKLADGGWIPVLLGLGLFTVMYTWKRGRDALALRLRERLVPLDGLLEDLKKRPVPRIPGTAVFMVGDPDGTPVTLLHHLLHVGVLKEHVVLFTVLTEEVPVLPPRERVEIERLPSGFVRVIARYGFMESPDVGDVFRRCRARGLDIDPTKATFFLGRQTILPARKGEPRLMRPWSAALFEFLSRNSLRVTAYFEIPPNRVFEIGVQIRV